MDSLGNCVIMPLLPLHKNSGRMSWDWLVWRLFVRLTVAEDPAKPLLLRTWATSTNEGKKQETFLFKLSRHVHEYDDGERQAAWSIVIGPASLWLALINRR